MGIPQTPDPGEITRLLRRLAEGDPDAFDRLFPLVYDHLKRISHRQLRNRGATNLSTTELVHESYIKLSQGAAPELRERRHFYAVAARAMRQVLVDHARRRNADKRRAAGQVTLLSRHLRQDFKPDEILALDEALDRLDELNCRLRQVVELRFFGGMEHGEVAEILDISTRTVERDWAKARLFLHQHLYPDAAAT